MSHNEFKPMCTQIKKKVNDTQRTVKQRHSQNFSREKIDLHSKNIREKQSKNRRFSKDEMSVEKKNKLKRNKTNKKRRIALTKESEPDQNVINLTCLNLISP